MKYKKEVKEAVKLSQKADVDEMLFCKNMAEAYGYSSSSNEFNYFSFLSAIYHYGKIQGVRQERAKRREKHGKIV
ncbi:hypothetical protein AALB39_26200 [Lachnospiraceae bacterium 54-53]